MAQTSGGWDNDEEDEEQGYSAEEMDIDAVAGGSAAVSGPVPPIITPSLAWKLNLKAHQRTCWREIAVSKSSL